MASAKDGYEKIVEIFSKETALLSNDIDAVEEERKIFYDLISKMNYGLTSDCRRYYQVNTDNCWSNSKSSFAAAKFRRDSFTDFRIMRRIPKKEAI